MRKNKGFTLIELLAVIVILAVIALIATPIVMNVINDSKKGADKDSAYGYMKAVELAMSQALIKNNNADLDGHYLIDEQGNLERYNNPLNKIEIFKINYKGSIPEGTAEIKDKKIIGMDLAFEVESFLYDGEKLIEKTDKNLFPVAKWQTNAFGSFNGPDTLLMQPDGSMSFSYTGKSSATNTVGYIGTSSEMVGSKYDKFQLYRYGIIVKPNTTYRYSVEVTANTKYQLLVLYDDKNAENIVVKFGAWNTNEMEFTTGPDTRYVTFRVDLHNCDTNSTGVYKNFQMVEK